MYIIKQRLYYFYINLILFKELNLCTNLFINSKHESYCLETFYINMFYIKYYITNLKFV